LLNIFCFNKLTQYFIDTLKFRKKLTSGEVFELLEEGKFYLACQLMNKEQNEEAIEAFKNINSPYASFYQAMVSKSYYLL